MVSEWLNILLGPAERYKMTNFDKIKSMSIDEMIDLFTFSEPYCGYANRNCDGRCRVCAEQWLLQEVSND